MIGTAIEAVAGTRAMRALRFGPFPRLKQVVKNRVIAGAFADADGFLVSYPKSGRTWLRFILANYLNRRLALGLEVDFHSLFQVIPNDLLDDERGRRAYRFDDRAEVPLLVASHAPYRKALFASRPVLLMLRETKDLMVSSFFHETRHGAGFQGDLKTFLRDREHGLADYLRYLNGWAGALDAHPHLVLTYEQLHADPRAAVVAALDFFALAVDPDAINAAIAASSFDRMQAIEIAGGIAGAAHDRSDLESRRVRRGKVGGHGEHLDAADIAYIDQTCRSQLGEPARRLLVSAGLGLD
jgi:hypothetical protein